ncbi:MAG: hypothetical protein DRQ57_14155, partial [Gammaproteobacteria bacterium]
MTYFTRFLPLLLLAWTIPVLAAQHALVVGINQYKHANELKKLTNLEGAVNDAKLLRDALHDAQVQLPERRVLLDAKATRFAFIDAWKDMLEQAKPGDTLIVTFAGHGGQQPDTKPLDDEIDNKDETLMFHDFNPNHPNQGRITDDELRGLLNRAGFYNILLIVDACHSSGLKRSMAAKPLGRVRSGGFWNLTLPLPTLPTESDEDRFPEHVTMITAVDNDILQVREEKLLDNKWHGALSWYFAEALHGKADGNKNGYLERNELERFLTEKVRTKTNNLQIPKLLPRSDTKSVVSLPKATFEPPPLKPKVADIAIIVENARVPSGLKNVRYVNQFQTFDLRFVGKNRYTEVFNNTGDKVITTLPSDALNLWQRVIDKERLLKILETQFDMRLKPIKITLHDGDKSYKEGEVQQFSIAPSDTNLNALTLFNLAGNGELQFLYPLIQYKDTLIVKQFPYKLPSMEVTLPFGGDDLIVVLCKKPAKGLHTLLKKNQPNIPAPEKILKQLRGNTCQVGQYA